MTLLVGSQVNDRPLPFRYFSYLSTDFRFLFFKMFVAHLTLNELHHEQTRENKGKDQLSSNSADISIFVFAT